MGLVNCTKYPDFTWAHHSLPRPPGSFCASSCTNTLNEEFSFFTLSVSGVLWLAASCVCRRSVSGGNAGENILYTLWHFKEVSVWVIAELSMAATFVYTIPASNSLFVKLFGVICIWRIPYKTSVYSFLCYAFGAWHIRVQETERSTLINTSRHWAPGGLPGAVERGSQVCK